MNESIISYLQDIKPLPGFQQAFGSTEIGRFSERFLQTPESLVERLAEEYATNGSGSGSGGHGAYYYDATNAAGGMQHYWPYEEQQGYGYPSQLQMSRGRMRGQLYPYPDYAAYERYGYAAYSASRTRYGEIRCNGY